LNSIKVDADHSLITEKAILINNIKSLSIKGKPINVVSGEDFSCNFGEKALSDISQHKIISIFEDIWNKFDGIEPFIEKDYDYKLLFAEKTVKTSSSIIATASDGKIFVAGFDNGKVESFDAGGASLWQAQLPAEIRAISPVKKGASTYWAIGTEYENRDILRGYVALISDTGKILWENPIEPFSGRPGSVRTITSAKIIEGSNEQIVAGAECWKYFAFDIEGKEIWTFPVLHASSICLAGDMTGNGIDEVALGTEYYYHWIVDADGKRLKSVLSGTGDVSIAIADTNNNGINETIFGRDDGFIKFLRIDDGRKGYFQTVNVGGVPVGIVDLSNGSLAVATSNNAVVFVNGDKKEHVLYLPDALVNLTKIGNYLYTCCRDGYVYKIRDRDIVGRFDIPQFENNLLSPYLCEVDGKAVVIFGKDISFLVN
jgi:hypothetical protein